MNREHPPLPVYILAGGHSSRFGSDKARARLSGQALIQMTAETLAPHAASVTVVAQRPGQYDDLGLRTLGDLQPGLGPLGGLATALADMRTPGWLALVACDWAGLDSGWLRVLHGAATTDAPDTPGTLCILYASPRLEPLFALYHSAIAETVRLHLADGRHAMTDLVQAVPHRALPAPPDWSCARNINRREDLIGFQELEGAPYA